MTETKSKTLVVLSGTRLSGQSIIAKALEQKLKSVFGLGYDYWQSPAMSAVLNPFAKSKAKPDLLGQMHIRLQQFIETSDRKTSIWTMSWLEAFAFDTSLIETYGNLIDMLAGCSHQGLLKIVFVSLATVCPEQTGSLSDYQRQWLAREDVMLLNALAYGTPSLPTGLLAGLKYLYFDWDKADLNDLLGEIEAECLN